MVNLTGMMQKFIASSANTDYRKRLGRITLEFKYQLQEFKDGNMLFEVMERNVWDKASNYSVWVSSYDAAQSQIFVGAQCRCGIDHSSHSKTGTGRCRKDSQGKRFQGDNKRTKQ